MRNHFYVLTLLVLFSAGLFAQNTNDKLIAYFPFVDCDGKDNTGNGSNGAFIGDVTCECGVQDRSIRIDTAGGVDDAVFFVGPLGDVFATSDFTVGFYIKPDLINKVNATQIVMAKQEDCSTDHAFWVRYSPTNGVISSGISENDTLLAIVSAKLDRDVCWQYVNLVRKGTKYSIYLNNTLRDTKNTVARVDVTTSSILKIGEPVCPLDNPFLGLIDELRIHSKALEEDEMLKYYFNPNKILNNDTLVYLGNSVQIQSAEACASGFNWTPATGVSQPDTSRPLITPEISGNYILAFTHPDGCMARDTFFVNVIDPDTLDCNKIFIPNAFTPGSSPGRNDEFVISNPFTIDEFVSFEVFDRWGGRVFNGMDQFDSWDGNFQGQPVNPGIFLYRLRYKCEGVEKILDGTLTVLR